MRLLLALALVALLAAPALAWKPDGPWSKPPRPFRPITGFLLDNSQAITFRGRKVTWESPDDGSKLNIVSNKVTSKLTWSLVGVAGVGDDILTESLTSVAWAYGSVVNATIDPVTNKLSVNFYGDGGKGATTVAIKEGKTFTLGPKVSISNRVDKYHNRRVNILVKGLIDITITQAYVKPLRSKGRGTYASALEVKATLLSVQPKDELSGVLTGV